MALQIKTYIALVEDHLPEAPHRSTHSVHVTPV